MLNKYQIVWEDVAAEELKKLPKTIAQRISLKIQNHLVFSPFTLGKMLSGNLGGCYSYRVGDYRVVYEIHKETVIIAVIRVGHRKDVYEE